MALHQRKTVGINDECLAIILCYDIKDDSCNNQKKTCYNKHYRADKRGESRHHASVPEVHGHAAAQHDAYDAEDGAKSAEERQWLVLANHAEDGAHHLDAVAYGVEFADGSGRTVAVLNWHLEQTQVVVQRVDGHFGFNLKAAR